MVPMIWLHGWWKKKGGSCSPKKSLRPVFWEISLFRGAPPAVLLRPFVEKGFLLGAPNYPPGEGLPQKMSPSFRTQRGPKTPKVPWKIKGRMFLAPPISLHGGKKTGSNPSSKPTGWDLNGPKKKIGVPILRASPKPTRITVPPSSP